MKNHQRNTNNATTWALSVFDSEMSPTQKLICLYLRTHMNDYRDCAWPSIGRIAAKCSLGERTVYDNLPMICEAGYLIRNGRTASGTVIYAIGSPDEGGAVAAGVQEPQLGGAADAPELTKELNNTLSKGKRFVRPTVGQVAEYVREKQYTLDPETFIDYYNSNGWKVGKSSMKDWKAAVRNWQKREKPRSNGTSTRKSNIYDELTDTSWA